jgi:hypothetical protein
MHFLETLIEPVQRISEDIIKVSIQVPRMKNTNFGLHHGNQ